MICSTLSVTTTFSPVLNVMTVSGAVSMNLIRSALIANAFLLIRVSLINEASAIEDSSPPAGPVHVIGKEGNCMKRSGCLAGLDGVYEDTQLAAI
jgi:hypothetical protein